MNERQMQFRVGVVVFATMIVGGLLAGLNGPLPTGWLPWGQANYVVGIEVTEAPGVNRNTPIHKNGILIGRVKEIRDTDPNVLLVAEIDGDRLLAATHKPHIRTTVLGDATIDFVSTGPAGAERVPDNHVFRGEVDKSAFESLGQLGDLKQEFGNASQSLQRAGDQVSALAERVNKALGDDTGETRGRVTRLLDTTERAMTQFAATMTSVNQIIGDEPIVGVQPGAAAPPYNPQSPPVGRPPANGAQPFTQPPAPQAPATGPQMREKLRKGLDELPDAVHEFRQAMSESRSVLKSADENFKNLEKFTESLGEKGPQVADSILKAIDGLDRIVADLGELTRALNQRDGTIGKLIHDPQVFENLNRLMFNANTVLNNINDLTFQLKPVVHDARIFMDKVALEPGRIISGALNPSVVK